MVLMGWTPPGVGEGNRRSEATRRGGGRFGLAATAMALALLAGCDTISDAATGTGQAVQGAGDWVSGLFTSDSGSSDQAKPEVPPAPADQPKLGNDERPKPPSATERQQLADSLVADNANAQYTEAEQKRMGDSTRPLTTEGATPAPAPAPAQASSTSPAAPVKKLASASDLPAPSQTEAPPPPPPAAANPDSVVAPSARVTTNSSAAPAPASTRVASAAPAPAPAPRRVTTPGGDLVTDTYRQRLAEFSAASVAPPPSAYAPQPAGAGAAGAAGDMSAPSSTKVTAAHGSGGAHPLSALDRSKAAATFQVAQIVFGEGTADLSAGNDASLRAVVEVYRDGKGTAKIGIVGHSNSRRLDVSAVANRESNRSLAAERASAVARALEKLGVPAGKIFVGATGEGEGDYAEVFVDY